MTVVAAEEVHRNRKVPGGAIEFEHLPIGTLTQKGEPRKTDHRAYWWWPDDEEGKRWRKVAVSTLLDAILPKPGLAPWHEAAGVKGTIRGILAGEISPLDDSPESAVRKVRALKLGADAERDAAASRGIDVHALLEDYSRTGTPPNPADFPPDRHGYIRALTGWLLHADPTPEAVEELVCDPEAGYAGRMDLLALIDGKRVGVDLKTSERGQIFPQAHLQLRLYERAHVRCGGEPFDDARIVVLAANGQFREMECRATDSTVEAALAWWRMVGPINQACEKANRAEREARKANG